MKLYEKLKDVKAICLEFGESERERERGGQKYRCDENSLAQKELQLSA